MITNDDLAVKAFVWSLVSINVPFIGWIFGFSGLKWSKEALANESGFQTVKAGKLFATLGKVFSTIGIVAGLVTMFFFAIYFVVIFAVIANHGHF